MMRSLHADHCFMSVVGLDADVGLTTLDIMEAQLEPTDGAIGGRGDGIGGFKQVRAQKPGSHFRLGWSAQGHHRRGSAALSR